MSGVRVILLCEDVQTDAFVRRFLKRRFHWRDFRSLLPRPGSQSGEQWVREQYPDQLKSVCGKPQLRGLKTSELRDLADELDRMCRRTQRLLPTAPPSLREACLEYPTLTRVLR